MLLLIGALVVTLGTGWAGTLPASIDIVDTARVLDERTVQNADGTIYLEDAEGTLRRFVTSTADPLIRNPGDGEFHPVSPIVVEDALLSIDTRFLPGMSFEIYILPYPVAHPLTSWAGRRTIYLSPGVYELAEEQIHFLTAHEVGHLVHRFFMPDNDLEKWNEYRHLRGIEDETKYYATAIHKDRPHEIFAEDFRVLFGSTLARGSGIVENPDLESPEAVPGLRAFFLDLIGVEPEPAPETLARAFPNPISTGQTLRLSLPGAGSISSLVLYDVSGRSVRTIRDFTPLGNDIFEAHWNGKSDAGNKLPRGVYFGEVRGTSTASLLKLRVTQ